MNVLVVGGAGFIGSYVVRKFVEEGYEVDILDPQWSYLPFGQGGRWEKENKEYREKNLLKGVHKFFRHGLSDYVGASRLHYDYIVHLANFPLAGEAEKRPGEAIWYIDALYNLIFSIREATRFTYISSSMVYGNYAADPIYEEARTNPVNVYGAVKLSQEMLTKLLCDRFSIPWTIVRPSAVYGPTDNNMRVVQKWLHQAFMGQPITVQLTNDMRMDFTYVTDTANGIFLATTMDSGAGQIFNVTRGEARDLSEVTELIKFYFEDTEVILKKGNQNRPKRGASDITKAQKMLQYRPWHKLEDGLEKYVQYVYENNPSVVEEG